MRVKGKSPDGTSREVPSRTREIKSQSIGNNRPSAFYEEPLPDPEWRFEPILGGWKAFERRS